MSEQPSPAPGPLDGVLVADFSRVLAGPLATMTLADLGARVVKVERPGSGDDTRSWGPPYSRTGSTYFESVNRNKESVALDLSVGHDRELARTLAIHADVLVENFKPGGMDRLGLGYEQLNRDNPGLIYASVSGFGGAGGRNLPGYDFLVQATGGLMSITGAADGEPMKAGVALVDVIAGKDLVIGVLAALGERASTGRGRRVEVNLLSSLQGALANQGQAFLGAGVVAGRAGNTHPSIAPYETLRASDGELAIACGNDAQFAALCRVLGLHDAPTDRRFRSNSDRVGNRDQLRPALEQRLRTDTAVHWHRALTDAGVPAALVGSIDDGFRTAQKLGLDPIIEVQDAAGRTVGRQARNPITFTPALTPRTNAPPALDEHGASVRAWLEWLG